MKVVINMVKGWGKVLPFYLFILLPLFASCSEADDQTDEWDDWQNRNDVFFANQYQNHSEQTERSFVLPSHDETPDDGGFVFLRSVCNDTTRQTQHINQEIENSEHRSGGIVGNTELGADEQHQHSIHNVVSETLAHVAQGSGHKALRVFLLRLAQVEDNEWCHNNQYRN